MSSKDINNTLGCFSSLGSSFELQPNRTASVIKASALNLIYFVGPTPPAPGEPVGSAGPTTSRRMEPFLPSVLEAGVVAVMGKGPLSSQMVSEFQRRGVVYLSAAGGAGAYYGSRVHGAAVVAYEELGPEAIYSMKVENFPAVVALDLKGGDLFAQGPEAFRKES